MHEYAEVPAPCTARPTRSPRPTGGGAAERPATAEEVAASTGLPLFRVRSGLRELVGAGLVTEEGSRFLVPGRPAGA